MFVFMLNNFIF